MATRRRPAAGHSGGSAGHSASEGRRGEGRCHGDGVSFLGDGEGVLVHELSDSLLQRLDDFGRHEQMRLVQILQDEPPAQSHRLVQVEEELLHGRVTFDQNSFMNVDHPAVWRNTIGELQPGNFPGVLEEFEDF